MDDETSETALGAARRAHATSLRRVAAGAATVCLAVGLAACGSSSNSGSGSAHGSGSSSQSSPTAASSGSGDARSLSSACGGTCTIGMLLPDPTAQPYSAAYQTDLKRKAAQLGVKVVIDQSNYTASVQQSQMQELIAKKVNGIILWPAIYGTTATMLAQAKAAKIPVDVSNSVVSPQEAPLYHTFTGPSDTRVGQGEARETAKLLHGHGNVIVITGQPGNTAAINRYDGFKTELAKVAPGIKILGSQPGNWLQAPSETATANLLTRFGPRVDAVVAADDETAAGAAAAIKNAGRTRTVKLIGAGDWQITPPLIRSGAESATQFQSPCWDAVNALQKLLAVIQGQHVAKEYYMPMPAVTRANVSHYKPMGCDAGATL